MKILLEIPLGMSGGYGRDGIGLARTLVERGHDVTLNPNRIQVPLPVDIAHMLAVENYQDPPYDLRITHVAPQDVGLSKADAALAKTNIYWTMWEWTNLGHEIGNRLREGSANYDHFVAYDNTSMESLSPWVDVDSKVVVQGGYESEDWRPRRETPTHFRVGMLGDISPRKNPVALINAFRIFKDKYPGADASCVIKSRQPIFGQFGRFLDEDYGILEINGVWDRDMLEEFYYSLGVYVAPSYGEGKNLPALEAATCGVPLILSECGGHKQWASIINSVEFVGGTPANLRLEGVPMWGLKVDEQELAEKIEQVYLNRTEYNMRARTNVANVVQSMDWIKSVERLGLALGINWL